MESIMFANVLFFIPGIKLPLIIFWVIVASVYFCFKLDFVNFRMFAESFRIFTQKESSDKTGKSITSRSAFLGAISGCVGVGSVSGVAASVYYGGPGVVFWLIVVSFIVMPLRFAEVYLGHHFRKKDSEGNIYSYGPFAYIKNGLSEIGLNRTAKVMSIIFALCLILTSLSAMMGQVGPTTELISHTFFNKSPVAAGVIALGLAAFTIAVIFAGLSKMSKVIERLAVIMSITYIVSILIILIMNIKGIPAAFMLVMRSAFEAKSIYGGALGSSIIAFTRIIAMN
jgi:AGCS family alanine or glycine:cation symporter